ncbi:hypothetical protein [Enterococcus sp. LJL120]
MFKKAIISGVSLAALTVLLAACGSSTTSSSSSSTSESTSMSSSMSTSSSSEATATSATAGEIIGSDTSSDGSAKEITLPGDTVTFEVPVSSSEEYLHFAFMHAASGEKGWYFAPESEDGIALSSSMFDDTDTVDITDQIALFAAPDATTSTAVTANDGDLVYGTSDNYLKATVTMENDMYVITIENTSTGDYETPFSSGVWEVTDMKETSFDHTASAALSTLATSGKRADLYTEVSEASK